MGTTRVQVRGVVAHPMEEVYDFILDMRNDPAWAPLVEGVEQIQGDGPGEGAVYRIQQRLGRRVTTLEMTVEEAVRPALITWTMETRLFQYRSTVTLAAHPLGCRFAQVNSYDWTPSAPWLVRFLFPLLAPRRLRGQLKRLRKALDA